MCIRDSLGALLALTAALEQRPANLEPAGTLISAEAPASIRSSPSADVAELEAKLASLLEALDQRVAAANSANPGSASLAVLPQPSDIPAARAALEYPIQREFWDEQTLSLERAFLLATPEDLVRRLGPPDESSLHEGAVWWIYEPSEGSDSPSVFFKILEGRVFDAGVY